MKDFSPTLSIIIPVFNVEKYLEQCLDSIINQDYESFELLLVNDGSTDKSPIICDDYASRDKRIRVFHKCNGGQSSARNLALDNVKGKFISFIDSDDYISIDFYASNIKIIEELDVDVVKIPYSTFGIKTSSYCNEVKMISEPDELFRYLITTDSYLWNRIFKRNVFNTIRFQVGMIMEDVYLSPFLINEIKSVYISNQGSYYYRLRENSTVSKPHTPKILEDILKAYLSYLDCSYNSTHRDIFIKYYATYLTGYFETKANFRKYDFSFYKNEYQKFNIQFLDIFRFKLSWLQRIKLFLVLTLGLDFVAYCFAPFFHINHKTK